VKDLNVKFVKLYTVNLVVLKPKPVPLVSMDIDYGLLLKLLLEILQVLILLNVKDVTLDVVLVKVMLKYVPDV